MNYRLTLLAAFLAVATPAAAADPAATGTGPTAIAAQPAQPAAEPEADAPQARPPKPVPVYPLPAEELLRRLEETERSLQELADRLVQVETVPEEPERQQAEDTPLPVGVFPAGQIDASAPAPNIGITRKWFDRISIRGYAQVRHNDVIYHQDGTAPPQHAGDRSVQDNQNFIIRRARIIIDGEIGEHMAVYIQPDFAASVPGVEDAFQFTQIRDWYADIYVDKDKIHRFRVGQSKVPYGWVNLQSSSNRAPLDRDDGLNSAVRNERDLGLFYYWTPVQAQKLFTYVLQQNLKGSGNYGVFGIGAYNGQGGSLQEQNDNLHVVSRVTYPFLFANGQIFEASLQGYTGRYTVIGANINPLGGATTIMPANTRARGGVAGIRDTRAAATAILYPQPIGIQVEWNVGKGPGLNDAQRVVEERPLQGGYAMLIGKVDTPTCGTCFPYYRWSYFRGGYKPEPNAPFALINEHELGIEWQPLTYLELTTAYAFTDRTNLRPVATRGEIPYEQFKGQLLRIQLQFAY